MSNTLDETPALQQPKPPGAKATDRAHLSIIGIGASAGGLTALRSFFGALPDQSGLTFVVIVHLSPQHESKLAALLQPYTKMPVMQVTEPVEMQPDHVYVIPPGSQMVVAVNALEMAKLEAAPGAHRTRSMQIDAFFRSLAENQGDGGAVILSGSGSDGAVGIQAIKEKGGLLLVQSPEEAKYDSMPRSAIATGLVDIIAPAAELATQLVLAKQMRTSLQLPTEGEPLSEPMQRTLTQILAQLRLRTGHDFAGYKQLTLLRRLARRMQLTQVATLTAYLHRLRQDSDEADLLLRDLLINVTEFFRDREAWAALESTIIPQLFAGKGRDDSVRVWTVGCATGEEAYSIAMLLVEYRGELVAPPTIQIFASDLGLAALNFAREGIYPSAIADDLSAARLERFFTREDSHYRVRPELRKMILFTQHNLLQDPPFSHLDLIICRNLLIYIQRDLQDKVFETFYYALHTEGRQGGFLFLGNAETADAASELFDTLDRRQRIYQCRSREHALPILPSLPLLPHAMHRPATKVESSPLLQPSLGTEHERLLELSAPPSLLIDRDYRVLHLSENVGRYLLAPGGTPTNDLLRLVRPELQSELRLALVRAFTENKAVATRRLPVQFNGAPHAIYLMVRPHQPDDGPSRALVFFWEDETPATAETAALHLDAMNDLAHEPLENKLRHVQSQLQRISEAYETTIEELRVANEELQSTHEEYKSTLEELETSKEEFQSTNEELQTINQELKTKVDEVTQAHSDLQNLFTATEIATLFLDRQLRVKRYTPRAAELFNLVPLDRGRPIGHLRRNLLYNELEADSQRVLLDLVPVAREAQSQDGRWFLIQVRPYRTIEDKIDGVVITFVDITGNKATEAALRDAKEYAESIVHTIPDSLLVLEPNLRVKMANDAFYETFHVKREATENQLIYELGNSQWNIPALRTLLEDILPENKFFIGYEVEHTFEQIGRRTMLVNGRRLDHVHLILLAISDITERKEAEEAVRASEEQLSAFVNATSDIVYVMSADWREMHFLQGKTFTSSTENRRSDWMESYIPAEEQAHVWAVISQAIANKSNFELEHRIIQLDGSVGWTFSRAIPLFDERGEIVKWFGAASDITERKHRQQQQDFLLKFSDALRAQLDTETIANVSLQMLAEFMRLDRAYIAIVNMLEDKADIGPEYRRTDLMPLSSTLYRSDFPEGFRRVVAGTLVVENIAADPTLSEIDRQSLDAINLTAFVVASVHSGERNVIWSLVAATTEPRIWRSDEITLLETVAERTWTVMERAKAEEALARSETGFRTISNAAPALVWVCDANGTNVYFNQRWYDFTGQTTTDAEGYGWTTTMHPDDAARILPYWERCQQTGEVYEGEVRYRRHDGEYRWHYFRALPRHDNGKIAMWYGVSVDIHDSKMAAEALAQSEEKYRTLFNSIDEGVCLFERMPLRPDGRRDYRYVAMNPVMQAMFGIPDLSGQSIRDNFPDEVEAWYDDYDRVLETGQPIHFERESEPQGMVLEMFVTRVEVGLGEQLLAVMQDVTERKRREANLAFLAELSVDFAPFALADDLMKQLCEKLAGFLALSRCDLSEVDEASDRIITLYDWRRDVDAPSVLGEHAISTFLTAEARQHYAAGKMAIVSDTHHDPLINAPAEIMDTLQIRAVVDSPYLESGEWKFLISVCRSEVTAWRADEIELIRELTARIYIRLERAHAEEAMRESEARFRLMADTVPQIIWLTDAQGRVEFFNKRWADYSGVAYEPTTAAEVAARFIHPEDAPAVMSAFTAALQTGETFEIEQRNRAASGEYRWFLNRAAPYRDRESDEILHWFGVGIDIQDRKLAEAALRESEERQAFLLMLSDVLRPLTDPVEIQEQAVRVLGEHLGADRVGYAEVQDESDTVVVTRSYLHGVPGIEGRYHYRDYGPVLLRELQAGQTVIYPDIAHDPNFSDAEKASYAALQLGSVVNIPLVKAGRLVAILFVHRKAAYIWRATDLELMQETADRTWAAVERARAEERLRQREAELALVQRIGGVGGLDIDVTNGLTGRRSPEYLQLHGLTAASTNETHEDWLLRIHPEDRQQAEQTLLNALAGTSRRYKNEYRIIRPNDGEVRWISAVAAIERNPEGQPTHLVGAHIDITERKRAEEALRTSEGRLRGLIENLPGGAVFIFDPDLRYILAEGEALHMAGTQTEILVGKTVFEALAPELAASYEQRLRQALAGLPFLHEHDAHGRSYITRGTPLRASNGDIYAVLAVSYDISDRKRAELALQQLNATLEQKVKARTAQVRELASTLTLAEQKERRRLSQLLHDDIQQLFYGIQMRLESVAQDIEPTVSPQVMGAVEELDSWLSEAIRMVRQLTVDLSPPVLKGEGLTDALRWLVRQMHEVNGLHVTLRAAHAFRLPNEDMRVLLFQIVRELLFNVVKHANTDQATVELEEGEAGLLRIRVSDQGRGFDLAAAEARHDGGFGLFSVRERLDLFGGQMQIDSAPGQGTRIILTVPSGVTSWESRRVGQ